MFQTVANSTLKFEWVSCFIGKNLAQFQFLFTSKILDNCLLSGETDPFISSSIIRHILLRYQVFFLSFFGNGNTQRGNKSGRGERGLIPFLTFRKVAFQAHKNMTNDRYGHCIARLFISLRIGHQPIIVRYKRPIIRKTL